MLPRVRRWLILPLLMACFLIGATSASAIVTREGVENSVSLASDGANDTIELSCVGGKAPSGGVSEIPCADVETIFVTGGGGEDAVNIANVDRGEFPALDVVVISVGEDFVHDVVNATKIGDEVSADSEDAVNGGAGNDIIEDGGEVSGGEGDDLIARPAGPSNAGPGDDRFQNAVIGPFQGGPGTDTYAFDLPSGATTDLGFEVENGGLGVTTTAESGFFFWSSIDRVEFSLTDGGIQTVDASRFSGALEAHGRGGHDVLIGGQGEDFLFGGAGSDEVSGGPGFDWVDGGADADQLGLRDGETDRGLCGDGADSAIADAADVLAGCEQVDLPAASTTTSPPTVPTVPTAPAPTPGDVKAPITQGLKGPKKVTQGKTAVFTFASTEANSTFKCKIDKGPIKPCKSPAKAPTAKLAPGKSHTFSVFAIDAAGNKDATPATLKFKVEPKPPKP
jgi:hypothetical protein